MAGASALPNRVYNVVLAGRQLAMWAPSQSVSRIPCLRFASSPGLSSSVPGPTFSALSVRLNKEPRSGDPAHWAASGSLRLLAG